MDISRYRQTRVELTCPDCGKFEIPRVEFDQAESESSNRAIGSDRLLK